MLWEIQTDNGEKYFIESSKKMKAIKQLMEKILKQQVSSIGVFLDKP